ncbi:DUF742 domain-containing protein [Saccharothrix sp. BKS2]|uniref:DUF742 domain-containing protein n=1 Tax=Saccharothrix sp. BKS2 TaxID=3064400 RepID=UPI0039E80D72
MSTGRSEPEPTGGAERGRRRSPRGEIGATGARFGSQALRRGWEEQPPEQPKPVRRRRSLRGEVGATGARFGSAALRRSLEEKDEPGERRPEPAVRGKEGERRPEPAAGRAEAERRLEPAAGGAERERRPEPPAGGSEAGRRPRPPGGSEAERWAGTVPLPDPGSDTWPVVPAGRAPEPEPEPVVEEFSGPLVRPYAWTGGRTSAAYDLRLETLLSLEGGGITTALRDSTSEQRSIVEMCATGPRSVAEVSALLAVPLGVARVLVGDLIGMGVVAAHHNAAAPGGPDLTLLERVLAGLRDL